jgi:hypothetical protein
MVFSKQIKNGKDEEKEKKFVPDESRLTQRAPDPPFGEHRRQAGGTAASRRARFHLCLRHTIRAGWHGRCRQAVFLAEAGSVKAA